MTETLRIAVRRFDPFESAIRKQFDDFVRVTGADAALEAVAMELNPLRQALFADDGMRRGDFDIAFLNTDWLAEAQAIGALEDLKPHLERAPIADFPHAWSPSLLGLQAFDSGVWGMPYHDGPECLIYRTDLFEAAELDPPETWEAFHAAARRLHDPDAGVFGAALALFPDGHNGFYDFCIHTWSRGGEPFGPNAECDLVTAPAIAALDFIRALARDEAAIAPGARDLDSVKAGLLFCEGKVALMGNWFGFAALGDTSADSRVRGKVGIAPLPRGEGGSSLSLNVYWVVSITAGSRRKALAWDFLRHLATAPMDRLTTIEGAIGVRRSTWADPEINAAIPYYRDLEGLHQRARQLPRHPRLADISHVIDAAMTRAVTSDAPSAAILADAQSQIETLLR